LKRLLLFLAILGAFVFYIAKNFQELNKTISIAGTTTAIYLGIAAVFAVLAYLFMVLMNLKIFDLLGIKRTIWEMTKLQLSSLVVNVLVPTAGASVAVLFADDARKREESPIAAVTGVLIAFFTDYTSIAVFLAFAILYLAMIGMLSFAILLPAIFFFAATILMFFLIYFASKKEGTVRKLISIFTKILDWSLSLFKKKRKKDETNNFVDELKSANQAIAENSRGITESIIYIFTSHLFYLAVLYIVFLSLGIHPYYRTLITGYAIGVLFTVVSPTPNGLGFVEGSMAFTYTSLGIPAPAATTVAVLFRMFSFWLPMAFGFVIYQRENLKRISADLFD
jgi:uncharacterized protein (TIRG00374 family)